MEYDWTAFNEAMRQHEATMTPYEKALTYLRAAAMWTDKDMDNPILARACRDCALKGLEALGEPVRP